MSLELPGTGIGPRTERLDYGVMFTVIDFDVPLALMVM